MAQGKEQRRISTVAATVVAVAVGAAMAYLGFLLAGFGSYALREGKALVGVLSLIVGAVLVLVPLAVLVGQIRSMWRRRG